ncbi:MAG: hypothetical protein ABIL04_06220 [candidate division WOR-3 bacterium]
MNVRLIGSYNTPGLAYGVYVSSPYAYVADGYAGLRVIDISNPTNPQEVGSYDTPDYASGVYILSPYTYVADRDAGLRVIDVSEPKNPQEVGYYDTPGWAHGVYVSSSHTYVADEDFGLGIYQFYGTGINEEKEITKGIRNIPGEGKKSMTQPADS